MTVEAVVKLLEPAQIAAMNDRIRSIRAERDRVRDALAKLPTVKRQWPSESNFILVEFADPERA